MPYVMVKKGRDSHVWTFTVHAADGDQLDEGTMFSVECWWPLRLLPGVLRDRLCRDQHSPTPQEINRFLPEHADLQLRYLAEGMHAFWPDMFPEPGLKFEPNPNWAD